MINNFIYPAIIDLVIKYSLVGFITALLQGAWCLSVAYLFILFVRRSRSRQVLSLVCIAFLVFSSISLAQRINIPGPRENLTGTPPSGGVPALVKRGFGRNVTGGEGGTVVTVTNLNDSGTGSLRSAVSADNRIVQFSVSGQINLSSELQIVASNITIDGSTAPNQGVCIAGNNRTTLRGDNFIMRYMRFRADGTTTSIDSFNIQSCNGAIIDHCSFSWGGDGDLDITQDNGNGAQNITVQHCILGENFGNGQMLIGSGGTSCDGSGPTNISLYRNLYIAGGRPPEMNSGHIEFVDNVVYEPTTSLIQNKVKFGPWSTGVGNTPLQVNFVGNWIGNRSDGSQISQCAAADGEMYLSDVGDCQAGSNFYAKGNISTGGRPANNLAEDCFWVEDNAASNDVTVLSSPNNFSNDLTSAENGLTTRPLVLADVGANKCIDEVDARLIDWATNRTGTRCFGASNCGGYPDLTQACGNGVGEQNPGSPARPVITAPRPFITTPRVFALLFIPGDSLAGFLPIVIAITVAAVRRRKRTR